MRHVAFLVLITGFLLICGCANSQDSAGLIKEETKPAAEASSLQEDSAFVKEADKTVSEEKTPEEEPPAPADNVYEIKEKMFIAQCNDVYLNPDDYKDRTIKLQGMYDEYTDPETKQNYRYVIRLGPGCCQNDSVAGFVILYDGELPKVNDWVEAVGTLETVKEGDYEYIALHLSSLTVLEERGAEYVSH